MIHSTTLMIILSERKRADLPQRKPLFAEEIYDEKSDRQMLWKTFLKKVDVKYVPEKLRTIAKGIERFLVKPLIAINRNENFDMNWKAPGPWK